MEEEDIVKWDFARKDRHDATIQRQVQSRKSTGGVICGTDQGFVGIIGPIVSGTILANRRLLKPDEPGRRFSSMLPTSTSLLERLRTASGEEDWNRLVEVYRPWILGWLCRQGVTHSDAEDLAQEILLVVHRELPFFKHNRRAGAFRAWLRTISVHRLRDFVRSRRYRPQAGDLASLENLEDPDNALSRQWDQEHDRYVVGRLLALIEPEFQESTWRAFRGVMLEGESPAQAAARLGMSVNAVLLAKSRVLARLREESTGLIELE